ncbi:Rrf2 family transcriptional regulator [Paenalkalicoccus suaedae]|uniref:Rrf2 family transcriptional regulator n=1 Tax=Paenalkalicoccus suaedae TaxID=2592382 RepID=A0A859FK48_9BACI|nr:Rrf2 family transcriptional regulator [Paenalkalicoccus suaedae]QKS73173.1 Rrf2 family transcriptional regulator [Paenalkalicoccus suaedae]
MVKYSKATNYALHTMVFLSAAETKKATGVEELAKRQELSPSYLSKILTKLVKAGLIESSPGANGGYLLKKSADDISFLDVIEAIEGASSMFSCSMSHEHSGHSRGCLIAEVMTSAEDKMKQHLEEKKISHVTPKMREHLKK